MDKRMHVFEKRSHPYQDQYSTESVPVQFDNVLKNA